MELAQARGLPKVLYVNLDDSLGVKDKQTSHIEPVDWSHDHNESTPRQQRYHKAFRYLGCTPRAGDLTATVDLRRSLRDKTVRRLNRLRAPEHPLHSRSKFHLARDILEALKPPLPAGWTVSVPFDSWYASGRLLRYVHRQGWQAVCALKSSRKLRGRRLGQFVATLRHKRYTRVRLTAPGGDTTTYHVRDAVGRPSKVPFYWGSRMSLGLHRFGRLLRPEPGSSGASGWSTEHWVSATSSTRRLSWPAGPCPWKRSILAWPCSAASPPPG